MAAKKNLFENLRVKLVVGALALLFWFAVVTENIYEYDVDIPIVAENVPEGKTLASDLPETARVRFEGKGRALLSLLFSREPRVELDLSNMRRRYAFGLQRQMVNTRRSGSGLTPLQILYPDTVWVRLTNLLAKPVRVSSAVKIATISGYTVVGPLRFTPDSILISGPEEIVRGIDSVITEPREFANIQQRLAARLRLQPFPKSRRIEFSTDAVDFVADVQKLIEVTLQEIPVQVQNAPAHLRVTTVPSTLSLTVEGGEKLLLDLKRENIVAYIDYARIRETAADGYPAYIRTPEGVRYRDVKPTLFKLIIETTNHASARH
jgi:YbbR domain-containing protein